MANPLGALQQEMEEMSNDLYTAFRVVNFELGTCKDTDIFTTGWYYPLGERKQCKFLVSIFTETKLEEFRCFSRLSERVNMYNILTPCLIEKTFQSTHVVIGFEFTREFSKSVNSWWLFPVQDELMKEQCCNSLKNLLTTMKEMHRKLVYHTKLNEKNSYVFRGKELCIVLPRLDGTGFSAYMREDLEKADIIGLGDFLKTHASSGFVSIDWKDFITLFHLNRTHYNIEQLLNHPVLKSSEKRFDYLRSWLDFNMEWEREERDCDIWKKLIIGELQPRFKNWRNTKGTNIVFDDVLSTDGYGSSIWQFLNYLTNAVKHACEDAPQTKSYVEKKLTRDWFPGLLGCLHRISAMSSINNYASFASEDCCR